MRCVAVAGWSGVGGGQWLTLLLLGARKSAKQRRETTGNDCSDANCDGIKKAQCRASRTGWLEARPAGKKDEETTNTSDSGGVYRDWPL